MTSETAVVGPIERWVEAHSSGERSVYVDQLQMCVASVDECGCDVREFAIQQDAIQADLIRLLREPVEQMERACEEHGKPPSDDLTRWMNESRAAIEKAEGR